MERNCSPVQDILEEDENAFLLVDHPASFFSFHSKYPKISGKVQFADVVFSKSIGV